MLELAAIVDIPSLGRDDSGSDRLLESERTTNREHPVTHIHRVRISEFRNRKLMIYLNLDNSQVGFSVGADHLRVVLHSRRIAIELHPNPICLINHVLIGNDVALGIDNHARSQRMLRRASTLTTEWASTLSAKEAVKEVLKRMAIRIFGPCRSPPRGPGVSLRVGSV